MLWGSRRCSWRGGAGTKMGEFLRHREKRVRKAAQSRSNPSSTPAPDRPMAQLLHAPVLRGGSHQATWLRTWPSQSGQGMHARSHGQGWRRRGEPAPSDSRARAQEGFSLEMIIPRTGATL